MEHNDDTLVVDMGTIPHTPFAQAFSKSLNELAHFAVFTLDEQRFALPLSDVGRIVRVVEMTTVPEAPGIISGVINIQGQIIPVINLRKRFHLPEREMSLTDQLIIARTATRMGRIPHTPFAQAFSKSLTVALLVDAVTDVVERSEQQLTIVEEILPGFEGYIEGVAKLENGIILICDLAKVLSLEEKETLDSAMEDAIEVEE